MFALLGAIGIVTGPHWLGLADDRGSCGPPAAAIPGHPASPGRCGTMLGGAVLAMLALEAALVFNDFSLEYVANHHARATPFPFNVATAWAALEGSIVLWGLVLAIFTWFTWRTYRRSPDRLGAGALAVLGIVGVFFFGLQLSVANPFRVCVEAVANGCVGASPLPWAAAQAPPDGPGPNPLLQNHILMAIHPPMLYLGYVGLTVPFAYAISALALGLPGVEWLRRSRRSTLVAWTFLTLGITLGGWWAYEVLSWGGYWAWDPVENASFMPWLVATAFLHSALVQMRRGALQAWNFVLVITAFALTILGTFLTRSGTVASVHSFTQSAIGPVLLGFLFIVLVGSFGLFAARSHLVAESPRLDSLFSREGSFLLNNLLLTIYAFIVVTGTLYPIVVEALSGDRVSVGEPFFNRLAVPLSFGLLLAMGVGPLVPWKDADPGVVAGRLRLPLQIGLLAGAVTVITTSRIGYVVAAVVLGVFVIASAISLLIETGRPRCPGPGRDARHRDPPTAAIGHRLLGGPAFALRRGPGRDRNGAGRQPGVARRGRDVPGGHGSLRWLRIDLPVPVPGHRAPSPGPGSHDRGYRDGDLVTTLQPRANFFGTDTSGITTPAVHSGIGGDLYLTLIDIDPTGILLRLNTSPGIWLLWTGGLVTTAGGIWSLTARRRQPRRGGGRCLNRFEAVWPGSSRPAWRCSSSSSTLTAPDPGRGSGPRPRLSDPLPGLPGGIDRRLPIADSPRHDGLDRAANRRGAFRPADPRRIARFLLRCACCSTLPWPAPRCGSGWRRSPLSRSGWQPSSGGSGRRHPGSATQEWSRRLATPRGAGVRARLGRNRESPSARWFCFSPGPGRW